MRDIFFRKQFPELAAATPSTGSSLLRLFAPKTGSQETIEAERRRKGSGPQGRAEAPIRRRETQQGGTSSAPLSGGGVSSGGGGGGLPGGGLPGGGLLGGGGARLPSCVTIALVIGFIVIALVFKGGGSLLSSFGSGGDDQTTYQDSYPTAETEYSQPAVVAKSTNTPRPFVAPTAAGKEGQTWLVLLYQDADDQILEQDIFLDMNEAEKVGSSDRVHVVSFIDRYRGAYAGDGNWSSTRLYYLNKDADLTTTGSQLVSEGEANMADGDTLVEFAMWGLKNFPADNVVLIMEDHGMGWPGGFSDPAPGGSANNSAPLASKLGNNMYLDELDAALGKIRQQGGFDKFAIIGLDACLMGQVEVYSMLEKHASFAIASEETEPSLGWAYTEFMQTLIDNPDIHPAELSKNIVDSYIKDDQRIVDDRARAEFLRQGSPMGGLLGASSITADQLAKQLTRDITLSAVDLSKVPALMESLNALAYELQNEDQSTIASVRNYTLSFTNIFGNQVPSAYLDLGSFVQLLQRESGNGKVKTAAQNVLSAIKSAVIAEKHGSGKNGATGIGFYFPNSTLYRSPYSGPQSYTAIADYFSDESLWDDFLAYHYSNREFEYSSREAVVPSSSAPTRAPGAGTIDVSQLSLSSSEAAPGQSVAMSADLQGTNIGYVYLFIGYYDQASNSIYVADTDYLESPETREVDGVYYPVWSDDEIFTLKFNWNLGLFTVSDGNNSHLALFSPLRYGATAEDAVYVVEGLYTFAESGEARRAQLLFRDGALIQVVGYTGEQDASAPREITPTQGDTFTIYDKWMDLGSDGSVENVTFQEGQVLTFGSQPFTWQETYAPEGEYVIGFIVTDMDGNAKQAYAQIVVK